MEEDYKAVLKFWFEETTEADHWKKDPDFDKLIKDRFETLFDKALKGDLNSWQDQADSSLALIIVLDQLSRNMFRNQARAFAGDDLAIKVAKHGVENGFDKKVEKGRLQFYMPYMHSEKIEDQDKCVELITQKAIDEGFKP